MTCENLVRELSSEDRAAFHKSIKSGASPKLAVRSVIAGIESEYGDLKQALIKKKIDVPPLIEAKAKKEQKVVPKETPKTPEQLQADAIAENELRIQSYTYDEAMSIEEGYPVFEDELGDVKKLGSKMLGVWKKANPDVEVIATRPNPKMEAKQKAEADAKAEAAILQVLADMNEMDKINKAVAEGGEEVVEEKAEKQVEDQVEVKPTSKSPRRDEGTRDKLLDDAGRPDLAETLNPDQLQEIRKADTARKQNNVRIFKEEDKLFFKDMIEEMHPSPKDSLQTEEVQNPSTEQTIFAEIEEAFGRTYKNIEVVDENHPIVKGRGSVATFDPKTNKIYVVADKVEQGTVRGLILHEKGVHEHLFYDTSYKRAAAAILASDEAKAVIKRVDEDIAAGRIKKEHRTEEIVASFIEGSESVERGLAGRMLNTLKLIMKRIFGMNLTTDDVVSIVEGMTKRDFATDFTNENVSDSDKRDSLAVTTTHTADYQSQVDLPKATIPQMLQGKALNSTDWLKRKLVGFAPHSEVLRYAQEAGIKALDGLEVLTGKTTAYAHGNMQDAQDNVLDPIRTLQAEFPEDYKTVAALMKEATIANKHMDGTRKFKNMSKEGQDAYWSVYNLYKHQATEYIEALESQLEGGGNSAELTPYINKFKKGVEDNVYFPMQRFGNWRVDATTPDGQKYVSFRDSLAEVRAEKDVLQSRGYTGISEERSSNDMSKAAEAVMDQGSYTEAQRIVEQMGGDKVAQEALWKMFMKMAPANRLKDKMSRRQNVLGASSDLTRGVASTIGVYKDIARRKFANERSTMFSNANAELEKMKLADVEEYAKADRAMDELNKLEAMEGETRAAWSTEATKFNFLFNLGFNPSSALVNLTQQAIVGIPVLGSKYGFVKSSKYLSKAMVDATRGGLKGDRFLEGDELDAMNYWRKTGTFDDTQANMHAHLTEGSSEGYMGVGDTTVKWSAWMFQNAEVLNRMSAGLAAYRLARDSGATHAEAKHSAGEDITAIHFDYAEGGKSRMQRTSLGSVLLAFKSYPIKMAFYLAGNVRKIPDPATRREGAKQLLGTMGMTAMFGGTVALPFASMFMAIADGFSDDEEFDAVELLKEFGTDATGSEIGGEMLATGIISTLTGTNLSGRVSLSDMFYRIPQGDMTPSAWLEAGLEAVTGPVASRVSAVPSALDAMHSGKWQIGFEKILPAAITNVSEAQRGLSAGVYTSKNDILYDPDYTSTDALKDLFGLTPKDRADNIREYWAKKRNEREVKQNKTSVIRREALAVMYGSPSMKREARAARREYNRNHPGATISYNSVKRRIKRIQEESDKLAEGGDE